MQNDPNQESFKKAVQDANLPKFDFDKAYQNLQEETKKASSLQHTWRQQGPELICTSCPHPHSQWVGMDKKLTGFDSEGKPILT